MRNYHTWLIDLDDTLQVGPLSWAMINVFPEIIARVGGQPDPVRFEAGYGRTQDLFNAGADDQTLAQELFTAMGWPLDLKSVMIDKFHNDYRPALFEDTLAFLDYLTGRGDQIYIVSNNRGAQYIVKMLGIGKYFKDVLTPADCGVSGKPTSGLWDHLRAKENLTDKDAPVIVGNNLRTDGAFSKNCGLDCIIIDRYNRFADASFEGPFQRFTSLQALTDALQAG